MNKRNINANFYAQQIFIDNIFILLGYLLAVMFYSAYVTKVSFFSQIWTCVVFSTIFTLCMSMFRMYNITTFYYTDRLFLRTLSSSGIAAMCISLVVFMSKMGNASRLIFLVFCSFAFILVILERFFVRWLRHSDIGNGYSHVLFIGDEATKDTFFGYIKKTAMKVKIDKFISIDDNALRSKRSFEAFLMNLTVDEVLIVYSLERQNDVKAMHFLLALCDEMGITARLILDTHAIGMCNHYVSSIGTFPVITYHTIPIDRVQLFMKSVMDVTGALMGIILLFPVMLITAIVIKFESKGPVFFVQERAGINGRTFKMYKFRSMYADAEERKKELMKQNKIKNGMMFKMDNDPRVTKVGAFIRKTSIDELPQLINVLKRDMSLVGTRPPTPDEVVKYKPEHRRRISFLPGITGMWQVSGRSDILDFDEVVKLDTVYIDKWSLLLDIKLLFKTVAVVFRKRGAY